MGGRRNEKSEKEKKEMGIERTRMERKRLN